MLAVPRMTNTTCIPFFSQGMAKRLDGRRQFQLLLSQSQIEAAVQLPKL